MWVRDFIGDYKDFLDRFGYHETIVAKYIKQSALECGYEVYNGRKKYIQGDKIIFEFRDKLIALVELGKCLEDGSNLIVSHMDSPRLDVIQGDPIVEENKKLIEYIGKELETKETLNEDEIDKLVSDFDK